MTMVDERTAKAAQEEAHTPETVGTVELAKPDGGYLAFTPDQTDLNEDQKAVLSAIGIDPADKRAMPHVRLLIHVSQKRGLSPWDREIYLVKRGWGDNTTYTIQTGIDGYRKLANDTGRIRKGAKWLWTGADDDPSSWREARDPDTGDIVMERVWWNEWPESKGWPGAARAIVYHYDEYGNETFTDAIAHWSMYAPFQEAGDWVWDQQQRKKVKKTRYEADGKTPVMELMSMWKKGYQHMLAKCSEALALRKAFPGRTAGIYVSEEMHQADAADARRRVEEASNERRRRYLAATAAPANVHLADENPPVPADAIQDADIVDDVEPAADPDTEPVPVAELMPEVERKLHLLAEIRELAKIRGVTLQAAVTPLEERVGKPLDEATSEEILRTLGPLRDTFVGYLRSHGEEEAASAYAQAGREMVAPVDVLFGRPALPDPESRSKSDGEEPGDGRQNKEDDAQQPAGVAPHAFVHGNKSNAFLCAQEDCGGYEDDDIHGGPA
jgi:hypothetical protein